MLIWGGKLLILGPMWQYGQTIGVWRAADVALVPDTEGIQNKVL